ncbi:MAG: B-box zinc finger protein [Candidatus Thorarchaeota archaeon]
MTQTQYLMCPVCGGSVPIEHSDKVNQCSYCASPILGPDQGRNCANHPDVLATEVCQVCGDLICGECTEKRVGDYGGKLLTIINCTKDSCVAASEWARPLNKEYQRLTNMDWADKSDNFILRITGAGAIIMMIFELVFILGMLYFQYFTPQGSLFPTAGLFPGFIIIILMVIGNIVAAIIMQTSLQVYVHERQLTSGAFLVFILAIEVVYLLWRGLYFNLLLLLDPTFLTILLVAFLFGTILVFIGSLGAIYNGNKKRVQMNKAMAQLNLSIQKEMKALEQTA